MTKLVALLGRLSSSASVDNSDTLSNSTRWVFDVEQDAGSFTFDLVTRQDRILKPRVLSFSIVPLDPGFYEANVYFSNLAPLTLTCSKNTKYRVTIDTVSSLVH